MTLVNIYREKTERQMGRGREGWMEGEKGRAHRLPPSVFKSTLRRLLAVPVVSISLFRPVPVQKE